MIWLSIGLALSTFVSEDLASISGGLLAREGHVPLTYAVGACIAGVYVGDLGLWGVGFVIGRSTRQLPWLSRTLQLTRLSAVKSQIEDRLAVSILVSRFVPGSRLPMYVAFGIWGDRPLAFAAWSFIAVAVWTPSLVIATAYLGDALVMRTVSGLRTGALGWLLTAAVVLAATKLLGRVLARLMQRYHQRLAHTIETPT